MPRLAEIMSCWTVSRWARESVSCCQGRRRVRRTLSRIDYVGRRVRGVVAVMVQRDEETERHLGWCEDSDLKRRTKCFFPKDGVQTSLP